MEKVQIIPQIIGIFLNIISKALRRNNHFKKVNCSSLNPKDIMGETNGSTENGFREDVYCERGCDLKFKESMENERVKGVIVYGAVNSGKSRLVYHYLKENRDNPFRCALILKKPDDIDDFSIESAVKRIKWLSMGDNVVAVFDDVNEWLDHSFDWFQRLVTMLRKRNIKWVATISDSVPCYKDFINKCQNSDFCGRVGTTDNNIKYIQILPISINDEVYEFCAKNLKVKIPSIAIGAYIPELTRYHTNTVESLTPLSKRILAAFIVSTKYRHTEGRKREFVDKLYGTMYGDCSLKEKIDESYKELCKKHFLVGEDDNEMYKVKDYFLLNYFEEYVKSKKSDEGDVYKYLSGTCKSEKEQIDCVLEAWADDTVVYERIIDRSLLVRDYAIEMAEAFLERVLPSEENNDAMVDRVISTLLRHNGYIWVPEARKYITIGKYKPTITFVATLWSVASQVNDDEREEVISWANELKGKYITKESLYYLMCREPLEGSIKVPAAVNRTKKAVDLYESSFKAGDRHADYNIGGYCNALLMKAVTTQDIDSFWEEHYPLLCSVGYDKIQKAVRSYLRDGKRQPFQQVHFLQHFIENHRSNNENVFCTAKDAIQYCRDAKSAMEMFEMVKALTLDDNDYNRLLLAFIDKVGGSNIDPQVFSLIIERMQNKGQSTGAKRKIAYKYLRSCRTYDDFMEKAKQLKEHGLEPDVDMYNALLAVVSNDNSWKNQKDVDYVEVSHIKDIIKELKEAGFCKTQYTCSSFYKLLARLRDAGADIDELRKLKNDFERDTPSPNSTVKLAKLRAILDKKDWRDYVTGYIEKIEQDEFVISDVVSNLMLYYNIKDGFDNKDTKAMNELINLYDKKCKLQDINLAIQRVHKTIKDSSDCMDMDSLANKIEQWRTELKKLGIPTYKGKGSQKTDLYIEAIKDLRLNAEQSMRILIYAAVKNEEFCPDHIVCFLRELNKRQGVAPLDNDHLVVIADLLQNIIYGNGQKVIPNGSSDAMINIGKIRYVNYSKNQYDVIINYFTTLNIVDRGGKKPIYIPLTSVDTNIRMDVWKYYSERQQLSLIDTELLQFIHDELLVSCNNSNTHYQLLIRNQLVKRRSQVL